MSECVVRMEMPKDCWDCPCVNGEYGYCQADEEKRQIEDPDSRPSWCPILRQLQEGHGRLVDADALKEYSVHFGETEYTFDFDAVFVEEIDDAPTIVPAEAERSETEQV